MVILFSVLRYKCHFKKSDDLRCWYLSCEWSTIETPQWAWIHVFSFFSRAIEQQIWIHFQWSSWGTNRCVPDFYCVLLRVWMFFRPHGSCRVWQMPTDPFSFWLYRTFVLLRYELLSDGNAWWILSLEVKAKREIRSVVSACVWLLKWRASPDMMSFNHLSYRTRSLHPNSMLFLKVKRAMWFYFCLMLLRSRVVWNTEQTHKSHRNELLSNIESQRTPKSHWGKLVKVLIMSP